MPRSARPGGRGRRKADTPHPVDIHVGARVRLRRIELGISQEKLAAELGLTFQQVHKYERAADRISATVQVSTSRGTRMPRTRSP